MACIGGREMVVLGMEERRECLLAKGIYLVALWDAEGGGVAESHFPRKRKR